MLVLLPCCLELRNEVLFVFSNSLFDFVPCGGAVLALNPDQVVDDLVKFTPVLARDLYSCLFKDFFDFVV